MTSTLRRTLIFLSIFFFSLCCFVPTLAAGEIKDRMLERLPVIDSMKAQGIVGENNEGFLEYRQAAKPKQEVVQAENEDRAAVYAAIARNQGVEPGFVGRRRALQIAERAEPGTWLQRPDGSWYQK